MPGLGQGYVVFYDTLLTNHDASGATATLYRIPYVKKVFEKCGRAIYLWPSLEDQIVHFRIKQLTIGNFNNNRHSSLENRPFEGVICSN